LIYYQTGEIAGMNLIRTALRNRLQSWCLLPVYFSLASRHTTIKIDIFPAMNMPVITCLILSVVFTQPDGIFFGKTVRKYPALCIWRKKH